MNVLAVLIVASAAACINVGKALQKQGTRGLPRLVLDRKVLGTYLQDRTWATGLALDVLGGVLMVAAIARAPVSLVQPVAAGGVAVLAVFSHLVMEEKLRASEWAGVAAAMVREEPNTQLSCPRGASMPRVVDGIMYTRRPTARARDEPDTVEIVSADVRRSRGARCEDRGRLNVYARVDARERSGVSPRAITHPRRSIGFERRGWLTACDVT